MQNILLVDNNDSFTYNIVDYLRRMKHVEYDVIKSPSLNISDVENYDKVIISPGPGLPQDFPKINELFSRFIARKSILGICLGHQALGLHFGAELKQLYPVIHGQAHAIKLIDQDIIFKDIPPVFHVGLYHSWAINEETLSNDLKVIARSEHEVIMAIKHKNHPVYGVQFHPESYISEHGFQLLENFVNLCE